MFYGPAELRHSRIGAWCQYAPSSSSSCARLEKGARSGECLATEYCDGDLCRCIRFAGFYGAETGGLLLLDPLRSFIRETVLRPVQLCYLFMKIGFIGLGHMGSGMARNLLRSGHEVVV